MGVTEKIKTFVKENKKTILCGMGISVIVAVGQYYLCKKIYINGFVQGANTGFPKAIEWFERFIPDAKVKEQFAAWNDKNPGEIVWTWRKA